MNERVRPMKEGVERGCMLGGGRLEYKYWAYTNTFITLFSPSVLIYNINLAAPHQVSQDYLFKRDVYRLVNRHTV